MRRILTASFVVCVLAFPKASYALLSRHNEQGLSPTHSYKRSGAEGVVSNLNGNLVVTSTPADLPGAPLGVNLTRSWNSHWRDPLFSFQYDMDYNAIDPSNASKQKPTFSERIVQNDVMDIGGFATRRIQKYGSMTDLPSTWGFVQSVSVNMFQAAASDAIRQAINKKYSSWLIDMNNRKEIMDSKRKTFVMSASDTVWLKKLQADNMAAQQALGAAIYMFTSAAKDYGTIKECSDHWAKCGSAILSVSQNMGGQYINAGANSLLSTSGVPYLTMADMAYNLGTGQESVEDAAWQVGTMAGQSIASNIVGGGMAGGVAGVAVATAIQLMRLYIYEQAEAAKTFDVGFVTLNPWVLGVNGYTGMLGTNLDPELQKAQGRFQRMWSQTTIVQTCGSEGQPACPKDEDGNSYATFDTVVDYSSESRHPMPDLHLVGADGGASRFILSDDSARTVDGRKWVSYVSLSNVDQRKVYFCLPQGVPDVEDLGQDPSDDAIKSSRAMDSTGYYLVKDPGGTQIVFGAGRADKGMVFDQVGYHSYWAVPSKFRHPTGDSVTIRRDSLHHVIAAWEGATGRGSVVSGNHVISGVLGQNGQLARAVDTVWGGMGSHPYLAYSGKNGNVFDSTTVVNWEAKRVNSTQIDTTTFSYSNGDLYQIDHANGSRTSYAYSGERNTTFDGFVRAVVEYPDRNDQKFRLERDYFYDGWTAGRPQALRTSIHTQLMQPDHVVNPRDAWRQSETTDWYVFAPMLESQNVNMKKHGYQGRTTVQRLDGTIHDTDKVLDSLEFRTSRFLLMAEYHGAGAPGMKRTQYQYNGDRKIVQIDSRGMSAKYDPKITTWEYDDDGGVIRERVCPSDLSNKLKTDSVIASTGISVTVSCPEVDTRYGVQHRRNGEFWSITRDTSIVKDSATGGILKVVAVNAKPNPNFRLDSLYQLGLGTSSRVWRKGGVASGTTTFNPNDSVLVADSTEYQDWKGASLPTPLPRVVRQRIWLNGAWQPSLDIAYAEAQNRPLLPFRTSRYLGPNSVSVQETTYDSIFQMLPARSRLYVSAQTPGVSPTGSVLDTSRFFDVDHGWVLATKDPGGRVATRQYDRLGRPVSVTNPDGGVVSFGYVDRLQPTSAWRKVQGFASNYPNQKTLAVRQTDPSGVTIEARFDGTGRMVAEKRIAKGSDPSTTDTSKQTTTLFSYNIFDKLQWKRDADAREEFHNYDGTGRLTTSRVYLQPALASSRSLSWENGYFYNDSARLLVEQDPLGVKTTFHWDGFGRDTLIERDSGAFQLRLGGDASAGVPAPAATGTIKVRQVFDNLGNLVKLTDPKGLVETRRYDERNRLLWNVYPDDIRHAMGYDLGSRLVTDTVQMVTHPESLTVKVMTYDGLSRLLAESYGASARENVTYAWDNFGAVADLGRLLGITRGTGVTAAYTYDVMGRRLSRGLAMPSLYSVNQSWRYDLGGGVVRQDLPGMAHVSTSYDLYHRLSSESVVHGNDSIAVLHDISYRQNDLVAGYGMGARLTETNNFEAQRLYLTQSLVQKNNSTTKDTLYLQRMSWDGAGNVAGMRRNLGDTLGFDVDRLYQLNNIRYPDGQAISTGFDPNGNRTRLSHPMGRGASDTFTYVANRVATGYTARKGWTSYRHDARGNLSVEASFAQVADTGTLSKAWRVVERRFNKRDELERVRIINRLANLDTTWLRFDYGEDGNRILSAIGKGSDTSSWTVTHKWVYDGSSIVADSGSDHGWNWHVYSGLNRVAEATDSSGKTRVRYVLVDHQGTTQALLSDTGAVLGRWIWDPWGNIEESWTQLTTELLYQGKVYEAAMGDWYFNARWYSPERGSFTGRDAGEQFWTPYSYTGNSPLEGIDPTGMWMDFSAAKSRAYSNSQADMSRYSKAWIAASRNDFKILHALNNFHYVNEAAREVTGTYNSIVNFLPKTILSIVALAYDIGYEVAKGYKGTGGHPFDDQPLLDWLYDTPGDMVANGYGLGVGLIWSGLQTGSDGRRAGDWVFVPVYGIPGPQHQACGEAGMNCSNLLTAGVVASRPSWWWSAKDEDWFAKYLDGDNSAINKAPGAK